MDRAQHAINVLIEHRTQLADALCNAEVERRVLQEENIALASQVNALTGERDVAMAEVATLKAKSAKK